MVGRRVAAVLAAEVGAARPGVGDGGVVEIGQFAAAPAVPVVVVDPVPVPAGGVLVGVGDVSSQTVPGVPESLPATWVMLAAARRDFGVGRSAARVASAAATTGQLMTGPLAATVARAEQVAPSLGEIIQYTLFNKTPTASPSQVGQSAVGVVSGVLNARSDSGAALAYSLAEGPAGGTVVLNADGSYSYTPTDLASTAGVDSFRVTVDSGSAYRLGGIGGVIQGVLMSVAQLLGLRQPDAVTVSVPVSVAPLSLDADGTLSQADLDALARVGAVGAAVDESGRVTSLIGEFTTTKVTDAAGARQVLDRVGGLLGAAGGLAGDITTQTTSFGSGEAFYRLSQTVNGVRVVGAEVILATRSDGTATGVFSGIDPRIYQVDTTPDASIDTAGKATAAAGRILLNALGVAPAGLLESLSFTPQLVIYAADPAVAPALAWQVAVNTTNPTGDTGLPGVVLSGPQFSTTYYIHANGADTGKLLAEQSGSQGAALAWPGESRIGWTEAGLNDTEFKINYIGKDGIWAMIDPERGIVVYTGAQRVAGDLDPGSVLTVLKNPGFFARGWFDYPSAVSAMGNVAKAYDFYTALGAALPAEVNVALLVPKGPIEAFGSVVTFPEGWWSDTADGGGVLQFGDGGEGALDFVGHEMTHAVISSVVGVDGFSGFEGDALDEAFGDIMGSFIENKSDDNRWKFSEDAPIKTVSGDEYLLRTMTAISDLYTEVGDPGEKYDKSTEFSNAAYRMMTDARTAGISRETWAQVFYSAIKRLPKNATFLDARNAVLGAAWDQEIYGAPMKAIADAFNAVGIRAEDPRVKIVLTWDETPKDLDAHLTGPPSGDGTKNFHVYYANPKYFSNGSYASGDPAAPTAVSLDYDASDSYGPESTTISNLTPGDYYFYVHDATNRKLTDSTALSRSGATVEVFTPDEIEISSKSLFGYIFRSLLGQVPRTFEADGSSPGTLWTVFKMTIPAATTPGVAPRPVITPINIYSYQRDPHTIGDTAVPNGAPVAGATVIDSVDVITGTVTGRVSATDPNGDTVSFSVPYNSTYGKVVVGSVGGSFVYTPDYSGRQAANASYAVSTVVSRLNVPTSVVVSGTTAYVVNAGDVTAINTANNAVLGSVPTVPFTIADLAVDAGRAYFTAHGTNLLGVMNLATSTVAPLKDFGDNIPTAFYKDPTGPSILVATVTPERTGALSLINTNTGQETVTIPFASTPSSMAVHGSLVYLPGNDQQGNGVVTVVNIATRAVSTITGLASPNDIEVSPDGTRLFVTTNSEAGGSLWVYNNTYGTVEADKLLTRGLAGYLAVSPDGSRVYASTWDPSSGGGSVVAITAGGIPIRSVDFHANGMIFPAINSDGSRLYVADHFDSLWAINTASGNLTDTFIVTASDGKGGSIEIPVTVPITPAG